MAKITGQQSAVTDGESSKSTSESSPSRKPSTEQLKATTTDSVRKRAVQQEKPLSSQLADSALSEVEQHVQSESSRPYFVNFITVVLAAMIVMWTASHVREPGCWMYYFFGKPFAAHLCSPLPFELARVVLFGAVIGGIAQLNRDVFARRVGLFGIVKALLRVLCLYIVALVVFARLFASYGDYIPEHIFTRPDRARVSEYIQHYTHSHAQHHGHAHSHQAQHVYDPEHPAHVKQQTAKNTPPLPRETAQNPQVVDKADLADVQEAPEKESLSEDDFSEEDYADSDHHEHHGHHEHHHHDEL